MRTKMKRKMLRETAGNVQIIWDYVKNPFDEKEKPKGLGEFVLKPLGQANKYMERLSEIAEHGSLGDSLFYGTGLKLWREKKDAFKAIDDEQLETLHIVSTGMVYDLEFVRKTGALVKTISLVAEGRAGGNPDYGRLAGTGGLSFAGNLNTLLDTFEEMSEAYIPDKELVDTIAKVNESYSTAYSVPGTLGGNA